jgi:hypothetical protein
MKPILHIANAILWGSVYVFVMPPLNPVMAAKTAPPVAPKWECITRTDSIAAPAQSIKPGEQIMRKMLRPERSRHIRFGSDWQGFV